MFPCILFVALQDNGESAANLLLLLEILLLIAFTTVNTLIFFVAYEAAAILMWLLILFYSESDYAGRASSMYLVYTAIGSMFIFAGFYSLWAYTGTLFIPLMTETMATYGSTAGGMVSSLLLAIGFGFKIPL
jgi:NADH-quinone oxidoreductase subunit M